MKKYVCDICDRIVDKPYNVMMKEFRVGYEYYLLQGKVPKDEKVRKKIHMCPECWGDFLDICNKREGKLP